MIDSVLSVASVSSNIESRLSGISNNTIDGSDSSFLDLLVNRVEDIDNNVSAADSLLSRYIVGENVPVHELMISIGKAKSSLELAVTVRNKLVESYKQITQMQI